VDDLVAQVEADSVARQRLAKHFHVSQAELVSYLRSNVKVISFSSSGWKPIYGVTDTGRIYRSRDYFHQGGKVFGVADGTPVMKYACGNPLITELPPVARRKIARAPEVPEMPVHAPEEYALVVGLPLVPRVEIPGPVPFEVPQEYSTVAEIPVAGTFAVAPTLVSARAAPPLWPLAFIPFLHHHHGPPPPCIPEPGTLLLLGSGLAVIGGLMWRRRR
jgi:hypothetical protein